jgi:hypothetical protein
MLTPDGENKFQLTNPDTQQPTGYLQKILYLLEVKQTKATASLIEICKSFSVPQLYENCAAGP